MHMSLVEKVGFSQRFFFHQKPKKNCFWGGGGLGAKNSTFPTRKSNEHLCTKIIRSRIHFSTLYIYLKNEYFFNTLSKNSSKEIAAGVRQNSVQQP